VPEYSREKKTMVQYWVVGASVQGQDFADAFVDHGFWYADGAHPLIHDVQVGDRLAIKRMFLRHSPPEIGIRALGVVVATGVYPYNAERCTLIHVIWLRLADERRLPLAGFGAAIAGPFVETDPRIAGIFTI
jgi:hypothetical protein